MQVENTCYSLGRAGFQTPHLSVFAKMVTNNDIYDPGTSDRDMTLGQLNLASLRGRLIEYQLRLG